MGICTFLISQSVLYRFITGPAYFPTHPTLFTAVVQVTVNAYPMHTNELQRLNKLQTP